MDDIEGDFHLNQRDLITLALLLGCDYDKEGVKYIGKQKAMELLEYFRKKSLDSLDRYGLRYFRIAGNELYRLALVLIKKKKLNVMAS